MKSLSDKIKIPSALKRIGKKKKEDKKEDIPKYDPSKPLRQNIVDAENDRNKNEDILLFEEKVNFLFTLKSNKKLRSNITLSELIKLQILCKDKNDGEIIDKLSDPLFDKYFEICDKLENDAISLQTGESSFEQSSQYKNLNRKDYDEASVISNDKTIELIAKYKPCDEKSSSEVQNDKEEMPTTWEKYKSPLMTATERLTDEEKDELNNYSDTHSDKIDEELKIEMKNIKERILNKNKEEEVKHNIFKRIWLAIVRFLKSLAIFFGCIHTTEIIHLKINDTTKFNLLDTLKYIDRSSKHFKIKTNDKEVSKDVFVSFFNKPITNFHTYKLNDLVTVVFTVLKLEIKGFFDIEEADALFGEFKMVSNEEKRIRLLLNHVEILSTFYREMLLSLSNILRTISQSDLYDLKEKQKIINEVVFDIVFANLSFKTRNEEVFNVENVKNVYDRETAIEMFDILVEKYVE